MTTSEDELPVGFAAEMVCHLERLYTTPPGLTLDEDKRLLFVEEPGGETRSYPCWFATGLDASR